MAPRRFVVSDKQIQKVKGQGIRARSLLVLPLVLSLGACSWFTDFKREPKIDPWETAADTIPFRGNPQNSIPIYGSVAPGFLYDRGQLPQVIATFASIPNPVPANDSSVNAGRIQYQINCAVCHGALGKGDGPVSKYGMFPLPIGTPQSPSAGYTDGYIFGIIRNGRGLMPTYNRIEEMDRWSIVNYLRSLQGKLAIAADTSHGRPGETGPLVPGASVMGPTRPAPYYHPGTAGASTPSDAPKAPTPTETMKPEYQQ
jgi:mono/diheme cytochrome c family protein